MKKIQDYISLYVGCELQIEVDQVGINLGLYFPDVWTVEGNIEANGVNVLYPDGNVFVQNFNQVKPILRPLSKITDLTKDEIIDLHDNILTAPDNEINYSWNYKQTYCMINLFDRGRYAPEVFLWLLAKGCDLFNLIPENLAIDATTLTTP